MDAASPPYLDRGRHVQSSLGLDPRAPVSWSRDRSRAGTRRRDGLVVRRAVLGGQQVAPQLGLEPLGHLRGSGRVAHGGRWDVSEGESRVQGSPPSAAGPMRARRARPVSATTQAWRGVRRRWIGSARDRGVLAIRAQARSTCRVKVVGEGGRPPRSRPRLGRPPAMQCAQLLSRPMRGSRCFAAN